MPWAIATSIAGVIDYRHKLFGGPSSCNIFETENWGKRIKQYVSASNIVNKILEM